MEYSGYDQKFEAGGIRLYQADCMKMLPQVPDKYYQLCICDPPYGIGEDGASNHSRGTLASPTLYTPKLWDREPPSASYFSELRRVSINQIIWGANHFIENIPSSNSSCWVVWYKIGQTPNCDFSDCELAYTNFKRGVSYFDFPWVGFGAVNAKEKRIHPTQKPVALYKWLLKNYAKPGDKILDTHGGSGSICIACDVMGYSLDWYEIDKEYYDAACERFERHKRQSVFNFNATEELR